MMKEYIIFVINVLIAISILNYYIPRRALFGNIFVSVEVKLIKYLNFLSKYPAIFSDLPCNYYKLVTYFIFPLCSPKITTLAFKHRGPEKSHWSLFPSSLPGTVEMILLFTTRLFQSIRRFNQWKKNSVIKNAIDTA